MNFNILNFKAASLEIILKSLSRYCLKIILITTKSVPQMKIKVTSELRSNMMNNSNFGMENYKKKIDLIIFKVVVKFQQIIVF